MLVAKESLLLLLIEGVSVCSQAYDVQLTADVAPQPILAQALQNSRWAQVFNPTWVEPSPATGNKAGLLVRSQNCTSSPGKDGCMYCAGRDQKASWLTWVELEGDRDTDVAAPKVKGVVDKSSAVFGPFDCNGTQSHCPDAFGTEDPRLTLDPETGVYYLLYNAWSGKASKLSLASTKNPTSRTGWVRHGELFPNSTLGSYKSGSIVLQPSGSHFIIWGCSNSLRITPSNGRDLTSWDYSKTKVLFSVRGHTYWDTGFVESAMPPLRLSDGNLLFFYDSVGAWNGSTGFQPGWAILSGNDPSQVLARAESPLLPWKYDWEIGKSPWPCNVPFVSNLGGGHRIGQDLFRVYFGGADAVVGTAVINVTRAKRPESVHI